MPNHFLIAKFGGDFAAAHVDDICYNLQKRWRRTQEFVKHVWKHETLDDRMFTSFKRSS